MKGWAVPRNRAFFELKGPDSVRYLNGQISNNVKDDLSQKVIAACVCTLKGKVEALIKVTSGFSPGSLLIEVDKSQEEEIFTRLDRYLIADDCELQQLDKDPNIIHFIGYEPDGYTNAKEHWRFGVQGYDIYGEIECDDQAEIGDEHLTLLQRLHGIPEYGFEISGDEFPASLGLDKWAVDFRKGCYLGQEIVSRMESAGKIPRRLKLYATSNSFAAGHSFTNDKGKEIARVIRDSIPYAEDSYGFLTSISAKDEFAPNDFKQIAITYPAKL